MAEAQAGQQDAQQDEQQQQEVAEVQGDQPKQPSKTYTQEEVDRILGKVRKNARYLGRKEAESELLRQGVAPRQAAAAVEKQPDAPPKREDFPDYEAYLDARSDYVGKKAAREEREKAKEEDQQRSVAEQRQTRERDFKKHAQAVMEDIPDFAETIESADDVMISEAMGEAITEAGKIGPRILYYLVQHPEEAARIADIKSKSAQAKEIGKIEARIEAELDAKTKAKKDQKAEEAEGSDQEADGEEEREKSDAADKGEEDPRNRDGTFKSAKKRPAPEPIEPSSARGSNTSKLPSDKDDINTWMEKREAEERRGK